MKKTVKILATILMFLVVIPMIAGYATTALWNNILTFACGFSSIGLWQGIGIFVLGQILSGGFILGCFFTIGSIHHAIGHSRGDLRHNWHNMTVDQRKEFIERRARFGFRHNHRSDEDAAE
ncbi:hypothetical protein [uncultured Muribaculum sp.]|uniref:hypothetical protein n=1 Tax=uncultured Muribaculum sp. TaxID=1918613 RepID=UPI0026583E50|nr:hypothetical protein [uncultured Muribaculum sp.]